MRGGQNKNKGGQNGKLANFTPYLSLISLHPHSYWGYIHTDG